MKTKQFRQGDVLVERVENETKTGEEVPRENGRVILAHGEVTGHAHAITESGVTMRRDAEATELEIKEAVAMLTHDEHATIPLERGTYRVIRQREYTPEAIRNVAD